MIRKLFKPILILIMALMLLPASVVGTTGIALANGVCPAGQFFSSGQCWPCSIATPADIAAGACSSTTTTTTTTSNPDTDGDGVPDSSDPCHKDKNAVRDNKGYCPSDETGVRNSSPGSLQGFIQNGTGIQQLYTNDGQLVVSISPGDMNKLAGMPPGGKIILPTDSGGSITLVNMGNGSFTGWDEKGNSFNINRQDLGLPTALTDGDGTKVTLQGETTVIDYPDGTKTTVMPVPGPEGSLSIARFADNHIKSITEYPDGTKVTEVWEGYVLTESPDGTQKVIDLNNGMTRTTQPDGTQVTIWADGTDEIIYPDGTGIRYGLDGTKQTFDIVRPGDTLTSIANRFGVTLDALLAANRNVRATDVLGVNQGLNIPVK